MSLGFSINVRLGIWLDDLRLNVKDALRAALPMKPEAAGLDAFGADTNARELGDTGRRDLAHFIRSRSIHFAAFRADTGGRRLADPARLDVNITRLREALQLASDCGVEHLPAADDKENAVARATLLEAARTIGALASHSRTRIAWLAGSEAPDSLAAFLNEVDRAELFEVDLNPGGLVMRAHDPLKALGTLSARTGFVTAIDHVRGGGEAPFGKGDVRWGEVLVGISGLSRSAPLNMLCGCRLEGDRTAALTRALARLNELRRNPLG
jgi:sugar phosphate isomerase/epimerase